MHCHILYAEVEFIQFIQSFIHYGLFIIEHLKDISLTAVLYFQLLKNENVTLQIIDNGNLLTSTSYFQFYFLIYCHQKFHGIKLKENQN